jgi:hypothetical protein
MWLPQPQLQLPWNGELAYPQLVAETRRQAAQVLLVLIQLKPCHAWELAWPLLQSVPPQPSWLRAFVGFSSLSRALHHRLVDLLDEKLHVEDALQQVECLVESDRPWKPYPFHATQGCTQR